ncbi:MAG: hypothetical protein Q7R95_02360 [bacterium]|nr:hypothetical protein [bacterium]
MSEETKELTITKECTRCHQVKPLIEYRKQSKAKLGVKPHCKLCDDSIQHDFYSKNKKRIIKRIISKRKVLNKAYKEKEKQLKLSEKLQKQELNKIKGEKFLENI